MLRTVLAVLAMAAAVAIFSCSGAKLGGDGKDAAVDAPPDACTGTSASAYCYRRCDGSTMPASGGGCPAGYTYIPPACWPAGTYLDGWGPVTNTCGDDGGIDAPDAAPDVAPDASPMDARADACQGTFVPAYCYRSCDGTYHPVEAGNTCAPGESYNAPACYTYTDGAGPITNTCGTDAGGGCTDLANDAPPVPVHAHIGDRPAADLGAGGVIADGIYNLVSADFYRYGGIDFTAVNTIRISNGGGRMEYVWGYGTATPSVVKEQALVVSGTQVTKTDTCGSVWPPRVTTEDYTATPDTLMFSNPQQVLRYSRRN